MRRSTFLRRMAFAAVASAFIDVDRLPAVIDPVHETATSGISFYGVSPLGPSPLEASDVHGALVNLGILST